MTNSGNYDNFSDNPYQMALKQLEDTAKLINLDPGIHKILSKPKRYLQFLYLSKWMMEI